MSDITTSTGFVSFDKDGFLSLDGVRLNIREMLDKIDSKPTNYIQVNMPDKFNVLDWWFNPEDGVLCMAVITDIGLIWKETTFGVNSLLKSTITSGEITSAVLNTIMNDFYAKIQEIGVKLISGEIVKNNGDLTNGELAFRKTKVINYIYNGDFSLPPLNQTGSKVWNRDKNGYCKTDIFGLGYLPFNTTDYNYDTVYDNVNKTYSVSLYDKLTNHDVQLSLATIHGEDVIDILKEDVVFSMDINVTKATTAYVLFKIVNEELPSTSIVYKRSNAFNLTPGRKVEYQALSMPPCDDIRTVTRFKNSLTIGVYLILENTTATVYDNIPLFTSTANNVFTFYSIKLNKGVKILDSIKDDFRNMSLYNELFPRVKADTTRGAIFGPGKVDFSAPWTIPGWCTVTTYKTILNDGTLFDSRDAESKEILTAMGYYGARYFEADIVIKKIIWTARDGYALPYNRITNTFKRLYTAGAFIKLLKGTGTGYYMHGAELNKWKLCGMTTYDTKYGYANTHGYDNNSTVSGGGELLIAMPGIVGGHFDFTNPTNWRIF